MSWLVALITASVALCCHAYVLPDTISQPIHVTSSLRYQRRVILCRNSRTLQMDLDTSNYAPTLLLLSDLNRPNARNQYGVNASNKLLLNSRYGGRSNISGRVSAIPPTEETSSRVLGFDVREVSEVKEGSLRIRSKDWYEGELSLNARTLEDCVDDPARLDRLWYQSSTQPSCKAFSPIKKMVSSNMLADRSNRRITRSVRNFDARFMNGSLVDEVSSSENVNIPPWFPSIPTRSQIMALKLSELKSVCQARGLSKTGNKSILQDRLSAWVAKRIIQRNNALETYLSSSSSLITEDSVESTNPYVRNNNSITDVPSTDSRLSTTFNLAVDTPPSSKITSDSIEPLVNRRKALLYARDQAKQIRAPVLGFRVDEKKSINDSFDHMGSVLGLNSTRQRIKMSKIKPIEDTRTNGSVELSQKSPTPTKEYLSSLTRTFYDLSINTRNTTLSNNYQIQQLYLRAKYTDQAGDLETAKLLLEQLRVAAPNDLRVIRRLARIESQKHNVQEARAILQNSLKIFPGEAHLLQGLGNLELKFGKRTLARKYFKEAIKALPTFPNPYHALGTLEHSLGNIKIATAVVRMGLSKCPSNHRLHHALGDLYRDAKMFEPAETSYRKGLECIESDVKRMGKDLEWGKSFFYLSLGYLAYDKGDKLESRRWLRKSFSRSINPLFSQGWLALAQLEESEGRIDVALKIYAEAVDTYETTRDENSHRLSKQEPLSQVPKYQVRMGDKWSFVYLSWAKLEETRGEYAVANDVYSRGALAFPHDSNILTTWAQFQASSKRYDRARTLFELVCDKTGSNNAEPYRLYAEFEMSIGNFKRARSIFFLGTQSLSESSDGDVNVSESFALLFHSWAVCEWHLGNFDRSEVLFDHALRLTDPSEYGSEVRSFLLYSIARFLFYARQDCHLAQHCVCLSIKDSFNPGGGVEVWLLWADIARSMQNMRLCQACHDQAKELDYNGSKLNFFSQFSERDMQHLLRRAPWEQKILLQGKEKVWDGCVQFPH